jgi:hypothetical protein
MDRKELSERLTHLSPDDPKRDKILKVFGCLSMATVILRLWNASPEQRLEYDMKIAAILSEE